MKHLTKIIALLVTLVTVDVGSAVAATTYYVDNASGHSGSDANSCTTTAAPCLTITGAVNKMAGGDTVQVRAGTYTEAVTLIKSGSVGSPTTLMAYPGEAPTIDGTGKVTQYNGIVTIAASQSGAGYITLKGFKLFNSGGSGVAVGGTNTHHIIIDSNTIGDGTPAHISYHAVVWNVASADTLHPSMSFIQNNTVNGTTGAGIGVHTYQNGYVNVRNNNITGVQGTGNFDTIQIGIGVQTNLYPPCGSGQNTGCGMGHHIVVEGNYLTGNVPTNAGDLLDLGGHADSNHYLVQNNVMVGNGGVFKVHSGTYYDSNVSCSSGPAWWTPWVTGHVISRFNVLQGSDQQIYEFPDPIANYNNTYVDASDGFASQMQCNNADQSYGDWTASGHQSSVTSEKRTLAWKNNLHFWAGRSSGGIMWIVNAGTAQTQFVRDHSSMNFDYNVYDCNPACTTYWGVWIDVRQDYSSVSATSFAALQTYSNGLANSSWEPHGHFYTQTSTQLFKNYASKDYHLVSGSSAIGAGGPLTKVVATCNACTTLYVDRSDYFQDGYCNPTNTSECLTTPDSIKVGNNPAVTVTQVLDSDTNQRLVLSAPITASIGDPVGLAQFSSITAPDVGAFQFVQTQLYVSTTGNDTTGTGASSAPYRTITKAISVVQPGQTINLATGTYNEKVVISGKNGTAVNRYVLQADTGATPVIDGTGIALPAYDCMFDLTGSAYWTIQGITFQNGGVSGSGSNANAYGNVCLIGETNHLIFQNNKIQFGLTGIWIQAGNTNPAFNIVRNNVITKCNSGGITLWQSDKGYWMFDSNQVYYNLGTGNFDGFQIGGGNAGTHRIVLQNNLVYENGHLNSGDACAQTDNLDLGGHTENDHYLLQNNKVWGACGNFKIHSGDNVPGLGQYIPGTSGYHIVRFNLIQSPYTTYDFPNTPVFYHNTYFDCSSCFFQWTDPNNNAGAILPYWNGGDYLMSGSEWVKFAATNGGDTDMGRMNWKNNLFVNTGSAMQFGAWGYGTDATVTPSHTESPGDKKAMWFDGNVYRAGSSFSAQWSGSDSNGTTRVGPISTYSTFASWQSGAGQETHGKFVTTAMASLVKTYVTGRPDQSDVTPVAGSPVVGAGQPLTRAVGAGTSSVTLTVDRASYFTDGYCFGGECVTTPDVIRIGTNTPVQVVSVNDAANTITIASPQTWADGASVNLSVLNNPPDVGAVQYTGGIVLNPPTGLRIINQ